MLDSVRTESCGTLEEFAYYIRRRDPSLSRDAVKGIPLYALRPSSRNDFARRFSSRGADRVKNQIILVQHAWAS